MLWTFIEQQFICFVFQKMFQSTDVFCTLSLCFISAGLSFALRSFVCSYFCCSFGFRQTKTSTATNTSQWLCTCVIIFCKFRNLLLQNNNVKRTSIEYFEERKPLPVTSLQRPHFSCLRTFHTFTLILTAIFWYFYFTLEYRNSVDLFSTNYGLKTCSG